MKVYGDQLAVYRRQAGFSQESAIRELHSRYGIEMSVGYLRQLEQGVRDSADYKFIRGLANLYDVSIDEISEADPTPTRIPLAGSVAAGPGIFDPADHGATIDVIGKFEGCVAYRVKGDSMEDAMISNGDYLIVRQSPAPSDGQIVVARIDEGYVVKTLDKGGLKSKRWKYSLKPEDQVIGALVGVVRYT